MRLRAAAAVVLVSAALSDRAAAQNWTFDARKVALGGMTSGNLGADIIEEEQPYRAIVLPFGLIQVIADWQVFDPGSNQFDPIRAAEYAASPLHYQIGRATGGMGTSHAFATAIRTATLSRDLNTYRGFAPASDLRTEGFASPKWGGTITLHRGSDATFHGIFVGAGPYLSMSTTASFDPRLTSLLAGKVPVILPNAQLPVADRSQEQFAAAVTAGYRGRFALRSRGSATAADRLYLAVNYSYLRGVRYDDDALRLLLETDAAGLLRTVSTSQPLTIGHQTATSGHGFAVDIGAGAVIDRLAVSFAANGVGNRITWTGVEQTTYSLNSLLSGSGAFLESAQRSPGDVRVELPIDYRANLSYRVEPLWILAEIGHGFGGTSFHGGVEKRFERVALRGGARYTLQDWNPTGGIGFDLTRRIGLDLGAFGTSANIERKRRLAFAASIRIRRDPSIVP